MPSARPIQIVGGGLAGLTLGIALRRQDVPVTLFEAGHYPRHRVCGEFVSGRGLAVLEGLGLKQKFCDAGAVPAASAVLFRLEAGTPTRWFPRPALCLSRFVMDRLLAEEFQKSGGELRAGARWEGGFGTGVVRASGRRAQPVEDGWRCFGLKAHARNVPLAADLELHAAPDGYVGLCRLAGGEINVCGLFRRDSAGGLPPNAFDLLRGNPGTALRTRLARAQFDPDSFCSVAGLSLAPRRAAEAPECCIGDALTMIPPFTGNGMSLAFESAQLAAGPLAAFSRGETSWDQARAAVARSCDGAFSRRLAWATWLQAAMLSPRWQRLLFAFALRSDWFWRLAFEKTR